jgi:hypothetical protein
MVKLLIPGIDEAENLGEVREKKLLLAVLARALSDTLLDGETRRAASLWLSSDDEDKFSFLWICEHLDLDPAYLIESWAQHQTNPRRRTLRN